MFVSCGILTLTKLKYSICLDVRRYKVALLMRRHSEHESKNGIYVKVMIKRLIFDDSDENKITLS